MRRACPLVCVTLLILIGLSPSAKAHEPVTLTVLHPKKDVPVDRDFTAKIKATSNGPLSESVTVQMRIDGLYVDANNGRLVEKAPPLGQFRIEAGETVEVPV